MAEECSHIGIAPFFLCHTPIKNQVIDENQRIQSPCNARKKPRTLVLHYNEWK